MLRAMLVAAMAAAAGSTAWFGDAAPFIAQDADLAQLLRCIELIKATPVLAAFGIPSWRFGIPVTSGTTMVYIAASAFTAGACALIWQQTHIPLAALVVHASALLLLIIARNDTSACPPGRAVGVRWAWIAAPF